MRCRRQVFEKEELEKRERWRAFCAGLEPLPELKEIPAEVRDLISEHLQPNEGTVPVSGGREGDWFVHDQLLYINLIHRDGVKHLGPLSGSGRTLVFARRHGKWFLADEGGWIR